MLRLRSLIPSSPTSNARPHSSHCHLEDFILKKLRTLGHANSLLGMSSFIITSKAHFDSSTQGCRKILKHP